MRLGLNGLILLRMVRTVSEYMTVIQETGYTLIIRKRLWSMKITHVMTLI